MNVVYTLYHAGTVRKYLGQLKCQYETHLKVRRKDVSTLHMEKWALTEYVCNTKEAIAWDGSKVIITTTCIHTLIIDEDRYFPQEYLHLVKRHSSD